MADPDSDEEETFVVIGTPLEVYEEDEVPKMPAAARQQAAKDRQGRQRFHGAFTGGFSAGYYNTVGSVAGFTPATFVSSKNKKADATGLRPEDFMDEEDLDEFGIAPRAVAPTNDFTSTRPQKRPATSSGSIIPGDFEVLSQLVLPARLPIGVKLLRGLGWKEGQGVGPRVKKKVKAKKSSANKVYGCSLPGQGSEESSSEDEHAQGLSFAPKDVTPISFKPKDDTHGIGYRGIDPGLAMGATRGLVDIFEQPAVTKTGRRGITGQAFGVGALEDDDDDIYGRDSMSKYDRVLGDERPEDRLHGWTAPGARRNKPSRFSDKPTMSYVNRVLEGFKLASASLAPKKMYPPPRVPRDYRPMHIFTPAEITGLLMTKPADGERVDAAARAFMIGDVKSVFDLVSKSDKDKIAAAKSQPAVTPSPPVTSSVVTSQSPPRLDHNSQITQATDQGPKSEVVEGGSTSTPTPSAPAGVPPGPTASTMGFKPFAKDPQKQERYEAYLSLRKGGKTGEKASLQPGLTEWERERERSEFMRAEQLYRPLSMLMASRFTHAEHDDDDKSSTGPSSSTAKEQTDEEKAAGLKMYGRLTRQAYEWHPDRVLCKRFNVPNPYPSSTIVGLPMTRRDKYSVFDFLTVRTPAPPPPPPPDPQPKLADIAKQQKQKVGPLAILNKPTSTVVPTPTPEATETSATVRPATDQEKTELASASVSASQEPNAASATDRPPMDLFKAIFDDSSDSDSSSSNDESAEASDASPSEVRSKDEPTQGGATGEVLSQRQGLLSGESKPDKSAEQDLSALVPKEEPNILTEKDSHQGPPLTGPPMPPVRRAEGKAGIFDALNAQIQQEREAADSRQTGHQQTPQSTPPGSANGIEDNDMGLTQFYGPRPPPSLDNETSRIPQNRETSPENSHKKHKHKKEKKKDRKRDRSRSRSRGRDRERDRQRGKSTGRDRRKDRSRSNSRERRKESYDRDRKEERRKGREDSTDRKKKKKKEVKSKDKKKKSKHKKSKSKKSKKSRKVSSDSEDADSESSTDSENDEAPSNAEILQRLMMLKKKP